MEKPINQDVHRQDYNGKRKKYTSGGSQELSEAGRSRLPRSKFFIHEIKLLGLTLIILSDIKELCQFLKFILR